MVDLGAVAQDGAALLEPLDPLVHRGRRQPHPTTEVGEARAPVLGQKGQDVAVQGLHEALA